MTYQIGKQRAVVLLRDKQTGEWRGEGHGYRIVVTPKYGRVLYGQRWRCRVLGGTPMHLIAVCRGHTLKWTLQECVRLADHELEIRQSKESACPT